MASLLQLPLGGLALLSLLTVPARAQVNSDAAPFVISYGTNGSIGPDGPWWFIPQAVDFPDQVVQMLPSLSQLPLVINNDACDDSTTCPLPLPTMWQRSPSWAVSDGNMTISDDVDAAQWDESLASLLALQGRGRFMQERMTLYKNGAGRGYINEGTGMMLSDSYAVTYPGGQSYTMDAGFFSLYGGQSTVSWSAENGTQIQRNRTLPLAYENGYIPSISYGLHVGSVYPSVAGSLVLGGYDSSRAISDPVVTDIDTFTLNSIGVSSVGGYMYLGEPDPNANQLTLAEMPVSINPGAPYMYLPRATCDNIAQFLPVTYNEDFNLYFWNEADSAFHDIVSSLHFLSFGFGSSNNRTQKINVPLGVLNLTLESPLVSDPTPYFPCSPLKTGQTPTLGRAFLQAAFLAQNWETNRTYLAQAPGPDFQPEYIQAIASDSRQLSPATNPPTWLSTWSSTLPPWDDSKNTGGGLSGGAIAGIVVGVIALLVILAGLAVFLFRRRKQRQSWTKPTDSPGSGTPVELATGRQPRNAYQDRSTYAYYKPDERPVEIYEAEARSPAQEMDSNQQITELAAEERPARNWKR